MEIEHQQQALDAFFEHVASETFGEYSVRTEASGVVIEHEDGNSVFFQPGDDAERITLELGAFALSESQGVRGPVTIQAIISNYF